MGGTILLLSSKVARTRAASPQVDCTQVTWPEGQHVRQPAVHEEGRGKPSTRWAGVRGGRGEVLA